MGILDRLLGGKKTSEDARAALQAGETEKALRIAKKIAAQGDSQPELLAECEKAFVEEVLRKADAAAQEGLADDALEWLRIARSRLAEVGEHTQQLLEPGIDDRQQSLEGQLSKQAAEALRGEYERQGARPQEELGQSASRSEIEELFQALVQTLREEVAVEYERLATDEPGFAQGVVALNEGRPREALAHFSSLTTSDSSPALRAERGRGQLLVGEFAAAAEDLGAAKEAFGEEPLDEQGTQNLVEWWAEAEIESGRASAVATFLGSHPQLAGRPTMIELYADALARSGEIDEALETLDIASENFVMHSEFPYRRALLLTKRGDVEQAREILTERLELAKRPGAAQLLHAESLELLCELLLSDADDAGSDLGMVNEVLDIHTHVSGGTTANGLWLRSLVLQREGRGEEAEVAAQAARERLLDAAESEAADGILGKGHALSLVPAPPTAP